MSDEPEKHGIAEDIENLTAAAEKRGYGKYVKIGAAALSLSAVSSVYAMWDSIVLKVAADKIEIASKNAATKVALEKDATIGALQLSVGSQSLEIRTLKIYCGLAKECSRHFGRNYFDDK